MMANFHTPVLLKEVIESLSVKKDARYIDCNLGSGGHTSEILRLGGKVLGLDIDQNAIDYVKKNFADQIKSGQLQVVKKNFSEIDEAASQIGWGNGEIDGILYDLGLSTFQLKNSKKGFSFEDETDLDMRMDSGLEVKAVDLIKVLSEKQLEEMIKRYGEDPQAKSFAKAIKVFVKGKDLRHEAIKAVDLAQAIKSASVYKTSKIHPATRVFQALRISVNSELNNLQVSLKRAVPLLSPGGRLLIITFHSLEDRIAKTQIALKPVNKKPIVPDSDEISSNPSSRSAKLRIFEKI